MESIRDQVKWFITHHVLSEGEAEEIKDDTNLKETGVLSSLWIIRLASFIEGRFEISLNASDFDESNFSSIEHIERLIQSKLAEAS